MGQRIGLVLFLLVILMTACSTPAPYSTAAKTDVPSDISEPPTSEVGSPRPTDAALAADPFLPQRQAMVQTGIVNWGIKDTAVVEAMGVVPRHLFVTEEYQNQAYANHPLPIGFGQTISQPYIVALMSEAAEVSAGDTVLEIGTGSGYQAAVLAEIVDQVYTVEIIGALAERAQGDLQQAGYENVQVRHADGYFGWQGNAPFDAIVVTAAPDHVPQPLVRQLKIGGHLIIPVGPVGGVQTLWRITRTGEEEVRSENLGDVRFVPFTREERQE